MAIAKIEAKIETLVVVMTFVLGFWPLTVMAEDSDVDLGSAGDLVRVVIVLKDQPHRAISAQVQERHAHERRSIQAGVAGINQRYVRDRVVDTGRDADNYQRPDFLFTGSERAALDDLLERQELLGKIVHREVLAAVRQAIAPSQERIARVIASYGGQVERRLVTQNALLASLPASSLSALSGHERVAEVVRDEILSAHLDIADNATLVSAPGGPWQNGETGGIFELAVVDSGADLGHPALEDGTDRTNYYAWVLDAATGDPCWADIEDEVDRQGHGTSVSSIVGNMGSTGYADHLGIAHGVEKLVTLKAAFQCSDGRPLMYHSDALAVMDLALARSDDLLPAGFSDDIEAYNLSYGGSTVDDDTPYMRFWDSVVSYWGAAVTLSAGNDGPSNTEFGSPAGAYNAITVANVQDFGTASRVDDSIYSSSSRGPTAAGRRKPDISAPGTFISAASHLWEGAGPDYVSWTGTSQAAPMVLGALGTLMDAGVTHPLKLRALLLNTAQKNEAAIDFEDDGDGWDPAYGWGYMNLEAAYHHRSDVLLHTVTESGTPGSYRLYRGQMQDEGSSGEGRDRVTLVWNRVVDYSAGVYPSTYHPPSLLSLSLFQESDGSQVDTDANIVDNVRQVRIGAGTSTPADVVVKVRASSADFPHGEDLQEYAVAFEEGFEEVDFPTTFQSYMTRPQAVDPGETFNLLFQLENRNDLTSHLNQFQLDLPSGWTLVSGDNPFQAGSIPGDNTMSAHVLWTVQAPSDPALEEDLVIQHVHASYGVLWGQSWYVPIDVRDSIFADGFESGDTNEWGGS